VGREREDAERQGALNAGVAVVWNIIQTYTPPTPLSNAQALAAEGSFNSKVELRKSPL